MCFGLQAKSIQCETLGPKFFFKAEGVVVFGQKFLFEIGKESTVVLAETLLDAIETGKKPFFLMKDIAEGISIPSLDLVSEILHG